MKMKKISIHAIDVLCANLRDWKRPVPVSANRSQNKKRGHMSCAHLGLTSSKQYATSTTFGMKS